MIAAVIVIVIIFIVIFIISALYRLPRVGGAKNIDTCIVVDTINLTHYLENSIDIDGFKKTITQATKKLNKHYTDRIIFVLKDRNMHNIPDENKKQLEELANKLRITIVITEQYLGTKHAPDPKTHSSFSRDDFYMCVLANKYKCSILTSDKLRDFREFNKTINEFIVYEYNYFSAPKIDFMNPKKFKFYKPKLIHPDLIF